MHDVDLIWVYGREGAIDWKCLKMVFGLQKSYANLKRQNTKSTIENYMFLEASPIKGWSLEEG